MSRGTSLVVIDPSDLEAMIERAVARAIDSKRSPETEWLAERDAAELLGVHRATLAKLGIPSTRVGARKRRYKRADLTAYLEGGRRSA